jgi:hypothetical protein
MLPGDHTSVTETRSPWLGHRTPWRHHTTPLNMLTFCKLRNCKLRNCQPISTKIYPREPEIAGHSNTYNSVIPIQFWDFISAYYGHLSQLFNEIRLCRLRTGRYKLFVPQGRHPPNAPGFRQKREGDQGFISVCFVVWRPLRGYLALWSSIERNCVHAWMCRF